MRPPRREGRRTDRKYSGDLYACGIGGSDYVEDRARLAVGGDCEKPSAVQADMTRVSAAVASASKLTSLISSSAVSAPSRRRPDERLTRRNLT